MLNAFTIDLEDWFCPSNLHKYIKPENWDRCELRIVQPTVFLLNLLEKHSIEATFFVLGWIAEKAPELVKEIKTRGHEIASHGYYHSLLTMQTSDEFRLDVQKSLDIISNIISEIVEGYRAPVFSITTETEWAFDILKERGISYDSSIYPFKLHPDYGFGKAPLASFRHKSGILEIPLTCGEFAGKRIPCSGGGYFRLYPYKLFNHFIRKINESGRPLIFYMHPWELDTEQPKLKLPMIDYYRHYQNINSTQRKLENLLNDYKFTSIRKLIASGAV